MKKNFIVVLVLLVVCIGLGVYQSFTKNVKTGESSEAVKAEKSISPHIGIGFFIDKNHILTANHVVMNAQNDTVILHPYNNQKDSEKENTKLYNCEGYFTLNKIIIARIIDKDEDKDLALLEILDYGIKHNIKDTNEFLDFESNLIKEIDKNKTLKSNFDTISKRFSDKGSEPFNIDELKLTPLSIAKNDNLKIAPGQMVCIPGASYIESPDEKLSYFMYFFRISGIDNIMLKKNGAPVKGIYFDKPVHCGISGSPVINSEGKVIAVQIYNIIDRINLPQIPLYATGVSSIDINDFINKNNDELEIDETKNLTISQFPEFTIEDLDKTRRSIVFIHCYQNEQEVAQ